MCLAIWGFDEVNNNNHFTCLQEVEEFPRLVVKGFAIVAAEETWKSPFEIMH